MLRWPSSNRRSSERPSSRHERQLPGTLAVAGLAALMLAGCVKQDPPGVGVQKLAADIVFGVKPAADTPPPNLEPGQAGPGDATTYVPDAGSSGDSSATTCKLNSDRIVVVSMRSSIA